MTEESVRLKKNIGNITIVSHPISNAFITPLSNLDEILGKIADEVYIYLGKKCEAGHVRKRKGLKSVEIPYLAPKSLILKFISYISFQFELSNAMLRSLDRADVCIFFMDTVSPIPLIICELKGAKTVWLMPSSHKEIFSRREKGSDKLVSFLMDVMHRVGVTSMDSIVVYSPRLVDAWGLEKYRHKILITHEHFLDFDAFAVTIAFSDRPCLIGYVGRLSGEKGIQHFVHALPNILDDHQDLQAFIGGDGELKGSIESSLRENSIADRVDMPGWISRGDLPQCLNKLRLLVLPSYTEGLPNIMLEAMACGTPVLATPVGAMPDIIVDGKTGFIMENNTPECIAENVTRALGSPDLEKIADAGRRYVEESFTFEKAVENWERVLEEGMS